MHNHFEAAPNLLANRRQFALAARLFLPSICFSDVKPRLTGRSMNLVPTSLKVPLMPIYNCIQKKFAPYTLEERLKKPKAPRGDRLLQRSYPSRSHVSCRGLPKFLDLRFWATKCSTSICLTMEGILFKLKNMLSAL